jgi:histidinol-phosphate aminotransferase
MPSPRSEVIALSSCYHGGPNYVEFERMGIKPEDVLDFSSNSNPYPFKLDFTLDDVVIDHYPDSDSTDLKRALAEQNDLKACNIIVGAGSMEIIRLITQTYFGHGDKVLILKPTFGEYEIACRIMGAEVIELWAEEKHNFRFDAARTAETIRQLKPKAVFICNPNNPTGQYLSKTDIEVLLNAAGRSLVILDEAYIAFTEGAWDSTDIIGTGNLIVVRSMTKDFALAGLRLGYGLAREDIIENLNKVKPPWNVNAVAQKAGKQAIADGAYIKRSDKLIKQSRDYLVEEFKLLSFKTIPTETNFFLVRVKNAGQFRANLMQKGIVVRDCSSFGLPDYVRIAPRTLPECRKLIEALKESDYSLDRSRCRR